MIYRNYLNKCLILQPQNSKIWLITKNKLITVHLCDINPKILLYVLVLDTYKII